MKIRRLLWHAFTDRARWGVTAAVACVFCSSALAAQVDVTCTLDPASQYRLYSDPASWSPQVVPNNGNGGNTYRVTISEPIATLDIDATVDALTVNHRGQLFVEDHSFSSAVTRNDTRPFFDFDVSGIRVVTYRAPATVFLGELANFDRATNTLRSGVYSVEGSEAGDAVLMFNGARILRNAGTIIMLGDHARMTDELGINALKELAINDGVLSLNSFNAFGSFINNGELRVTKSFKAFSNFTNNGGVSLSRESASLVVAKLTNFDPATKTLTGGRFAVYDFGFASIGLLQFTGADIVTNSADIFVARRFGDTNPKIVDEKGADALRNFANNTSTGRIVFFIGDFATSATHFTNTGYLSSDENLTLGPGGVFEQFGGEFHINGVLDTQGGSIVLHGGVVGGGTFIGDTTSNTFISPDVDAYTAPMTIQGNLTLNSASILHFRVGGTSRPMATPPDPRGDPPPRDSYDAIDCTGLVRLDGRIQAALDVQGLSQTRFAPAPDDTFVIVKAQTPIFGSFANAANGERVATTDGGGSFKVNYGLTSTFDPTAVVLSDFQPNTSRDVLLNISTRGLAGTGDRAMIAGFIITGTQPKPVIIRAIGPSLGAYSVTTPLDDPTLSLHDSTGAIIASNDDWIQSSQRAEIERTGIPPNHWRESAIMATLAPGTYTAVVEAKNGGSGIALVEVYDLDITRDSQLANISTRGLSDVGSSSNAMLIGGVIVGGGSTPSRIVVRALGPSLTNKGVDGALPDPVVYLEQFNGLSYSNDNWTTNEAQIEATGLAPSDDREAALVQSLAPGAYTATLRPAAGSAGGVALVELYRLK